MLTAGFFQSGPIRTAASWVAGLIGVITLVKFFLVAIKPNEMGIRMRNERPVYNKEGFWCFSWRTGFLFMETNRYIRTCTSRVAAKIPMLYDVRVVSIAHETRKIDPITVDSPDQVQYDLDGSVTYRVIPEGWALFASVQQSQMIDTTVIAIMTNVVSDVVRAFLCSTPDLSAIDEAVTATAQPLLREYGIELISLQLTTPRRSSVQVLRELPNNPQRFSVVRSMLALNLLRPR